MISAPWLFLAALCSDFASGTLPASGTQRPFYIIGHMANSIERMDAYLAGGANALEVDISCEPNGTASTVYHGQPCFELRGCFDSTVFTTWLDAARMRDFSVLVLDFKCGKLNESALRFTGVDVARKLVDHFWVSSNINVVLSIPKLGQQSIFDAFKRELSTLKASEHRKVSYDVSEHAVIDEIEHMYHELQITSAFQGEGIISLFEPFRSHGFLKQAIGRRETGVSVFKKVYRWTVDTEDRIRELIELGADGLITNRPDRAAEVLKEFKGVRMATQEDPVNERFLADSLV